MCAWRPSGGSFRRQTGVNRARGSADERSRLTCRPRLRPVNLSDAERVAVRQPAPDRILIEWRVGNQSFTRDFRADAGEFLDPEDAVWLLLKHETPESLMRSAVAACWPDFDIDAEIDNATMPDRAEWRRQDAERRRRLRDDFLRSQGQV